VSRAAVRNRRWRLVRTRRDGVSAVMQRRLRDRRAGSAGLWMSASGLIVLLAIASWIVLGTSVLGVRRVDVTGSTLVSPEQVRSVAAVAEGTPLARVNTTAVRDRLRTLPSVKDVSISRSWPTTLRIDVTERIAVAVVAATGGFTVIDADGVLFQTVAARPTGLPLLAVANPGPSDATTRAVLRVLAALTPPLRGSLVRLAADAPTRIRLELPGGRVIIWGDAEHSDTKARVASALLDRPVRTIDVSSPDAVTTSA
jgi:cell division protein FtsQ